VELRKYYQNALGKLDMTTVISRSYKECNTQVEQLDKKVANQTTEISNLTTVCEEALAELNTRELFHKGEMANMDEELKKAKTAEARMTFRLEFSQNVQSESAAQHTAEMNQLQNRIVKADLEKGLSKRLADAASAAAAAASASTEAALLEVRKHVDQLEQNLLLQQQTLLLQLGEQHQIEELTAKELSALKVCVCTYVYCERMHINELTEQQTFVQHIVHTTINVCINVVL